MRKQTALVLAATAIVMLLALWVSGAERVWFINDTNQAGDTSGSDLREPGSAEKQPRPDGSADVAQDDKVGVWFDIVASVFLGALALGLLAMLVRRTQARRRRRRKARQNAADVSALPSALADAIEVPQELITATDDLQVLLMEGSPRNAIVRCWVALEEACSRAGVARHPAETSVEFTTRVLSTFALTEESIASLAALYREARFSAHVLTEQHRVAAIESLQEVQSQLRARVRREAQAQP